MMMPKILNCPKCGEKYMAEDVEAPCPVCGTEHVVRLNCSKCDSDFMAHYMEAPCPVCSAREDGERVVTYAMPCPVCELANGFPEGGCPVCGDNRYNFGIRKLRD